MDNHASSGTQAALLRRSGYQEPQAQARKTHADKVRDGQGDDARPPHESRRRESPLTVPQRRLPVLETDEFRVVEPDGTEDPWASADDGLVPERPSDAGAKEPRGEND